MLNNLIKRLITKSLFLLGIIKDRWCLAIVDNRFKIKKIFYPPKNFFWADPFFFNYKKKKFIFFERYSFIKKRGEIACGEFKNQNIINIRCVLKKNYHLSYPFIFSFKKNIYLIPETNEKKRIEVYKCIKFPTKWKLFSIGLENKRVVDTTILKYKKNLWLFTNQMISKENEFNKLLYIYKINNPNLNSIKAHFKNPVIDNINIARNAGSFLIHKKKFFRPSQINKLDRYGYGLNISEIKKLNLFDYKEKKVKEIHPLKKSTSGIHHISKINKRNYFVDICLKYSLNK